MDYIMTNLQTSVISCFPTFIKPLMDAIGYTALALGRVHGRIGPLQLLETFVCYHDPADFGRGVIC